jgi:hypothetical protein
MHFGLAATIAPQAMRPLAGGRVTRRPLNQKMCEVFNGVAGESLGGSPQEPARGPKAPWFGEGDTLTGEPAAPWICQRQPPTSCFLAHFPQ